MSDGAPVPTVTTEKTDPTAQVKEKTAGFLKKVLTDKGNSPSSKRLIAFACVLLGMLVGTVISGIVVTGWLRPELVEKIPQAALNTLELGLDFVKFFITALFTVAGLALGLTIPEWFSNKFVPVAPKQ